MVQVDGIPINVHDGQCYDPITGWLGASEIIGITLIEFQPQVAKRKKDLKAA